MSRSGDPHGTAEASGVFRALPDIWELREQLDAGVQPSELGLMDALADAITEERDPFMESTLYETNAGEQYQIWHVRFADDIAGEHWYHTVYAEYGHAFAADDPGDSKDATGRETIARMLRRIEQETDHRAGRHMAPEGDCEPCEGEPRGPQRQGGEDTAGR